MNMNEFEELAPHTHTHAPSQCVPAPVHAPPPLISPLLQSNPTSPLGQDYYAHTRVERRSLNLSTFFFTPNTGK